ncbi:hypothetical protein [Methanosarcina barkeri]|nr:hypothetical protein [Methanosarcina barkeri]
MIKLEKVSYSYPDGTLALENINLVIKKGEFIGVIGKKTAVENPHLPFN